MAVHLHLGSRSRERERARRREADVELALLPDVPGRLAWRLQELTCRKQRLSLARRLRGVVREANPRYLPGASPLHRPAVRAEQESLGRLAARLEALDRPVSPRGVLLVERLLEDADWPLYAVEPEQRLDETIELALEALEVQS